MENGEISARVGEIIEKEICRQFDFTFNTNQQEHGYFDASRNEEIFEIKSAVNKNRFILNQSNHDELLSHNGCYIFIKYRFLNERKEIFSIKDIEIDNIIFIKAKNINKSKLRPYKGNKYYRIRIKT